MRVLKILFLHVFLLFSSLAWSKATPLDGIAAIVNEGIITKSQLADQLVRVEAQLRSSGNPVPDHKTLEKQVLDQMILTEIQMQMAKRTGIQIDDNTLDNAIEGIAQQNQMSVSQLREAVQSQGMTFNQYRNTIKQQIAISQLQQRDLLHDIQISEQEIDQFLKSQNGPQDLSVEYRLGHILIPLPEAPSPEVLNSAQNKANEIVKKLRDGADFAAIAIAESKDEKALDGGDLGWRKLPELPTIFEKIVISLNVKDVPLPIRSSSGFHVIKLIDKRQTHASMPTKSLAQHILIKTNASTSDNDAKKRLDELRDKILKGEDFAKLAKTYSDDMATVSNGGKMGWVTPNMLVNEFNEEMNKLDINEVSQPFKTSFGWHIVQVLERKKASQDESGIRQQAKEMIQQRKFEEKVQTWARQLRDEAFVKVQIES